MENENIIFNEMFDKYLERLKKLKLDEKLYAQMSEMLEREGIIWSEVRRIIGTGNSTVYKIGKKILKIQAFREIEEPYEDEVILPSKFEKIFDDLYIEIQDEIQTSTNSDVTFTEEDVYRVYKDLRKRRNCFWIDAKSSNLVLTEDGKIVAVDTDGFYDLNNKDIANNSGILANLDASEYEQRYQRECRWNSYDEELSQ